MKVDTFYKKEPHSSNTNRIFQEIYFQKETSKQEISRRLSLSLPTVAQSLKELYGMGIIEKTATLILPAAERRRSSPWRTSQKLPWAYLCSGNGL